MNRRRVRLVPYWRRLWRSLSVQAMFLAGVLQVAWDTAPHVITAVLPPAWVPWVTVGFLLFGIAGRAVQQPTVHDEQPR